VKPRVFVRGTIDVPRGLLTSDEIAEDGRALACANPARVAAERQGDRRARRHPELISSLLVEDEWVRYPFAAAAIYRARLREKAYVLVDERPSHEPEPRPYRGTLLPFQTACVEALSRVTCGVALAPCGAGKGEVIVALTGALGLPTLIIVGQREHAHDLRSRLSARLGAEVGLVGDGVRDVRKNTVALVQSLDCAMLAEIGDRFEAVLVDEAHHAAAEGYRTVLSALSARRRYGFTATIDRPDGLRPFVHHMLGPVVHETTRAALVNAGRSVVPSYVTIPTAFRYRYTGPTDWAPLLAALESNTDRDDVIVDTVERECAGELTAVLVGRVAHAERLAAHIRGRGLRAQALTGKLAKKKRASILDGARLGQIDVIVGTQLLDEGIDLPRLSRVVLAWPARSEGRIVQRIGRALRVHESKASPIVFDITDPAIGVLHNQARQRRRIFAQAFTSDRRVAA
jgi:superfamily II DNA or RNA helicase